MSGEGAILVGFIDVDLGRPQPGGRGLSETLEGVEGLYCRVLGQYVLQLTEVVLGLVSSAVRLLHTGDRD